MGHPWARSPSSVLFLRPVLEALIWHGFEDSEDLGDWKRFPENALVMRRSSVRVRSPAPEASRFPAANNYPLDRTRIALNYCEQNPGRAVWNGATLLPLLNCSL